MSVLEIPFVPPHLRVGQIAPPTIVKENDDVVTCPTPEAWHEPMGIDFPESKNKNMEATASNFPGVFTVSGGPNNACGGLGGKDAVLVDLASRGVGSAVESLRAQLISDNILREGQEGIQATQLAQSILMKEITQSRFEAKEGQRETETKVKEDGERTRDLLRAQDAARVQETMLQLRAEIAALKAVSAAP